MTTKCKTQGCERDSHTRGWCAAHYKRVTRTGSDLSEIPLSGCAKTVHQRLFEKTVVNELNGCVEWIAASVPFGYGLIAYQGKQQYAHRVSWQLKHGDIPHGMFVLHRCDNPRCVNADHLFLGTLSDNTKDMIRKNRQRLNPAHGERNWMKKNGYKLSGENNGYSKLKFSDVSEIRRLGKTNKTQKDIAEIFSVSRSTVGRILRGESWLHYSF